MFGSRLHTCSRATFCGARCYGVPAVSSLAPVSSLLSPLRCANDANAGSSSASSGSRASHDGRLAAFAAASLALAAASERRTQACCESTERVELGKVADFADGSMQGVSGMQWCDSIALRFQFRGVDCTAIPMVLVGPQGSKSLLLVHKHNGVFYATSPACSHYGTPLRKGKESIDATFELKTGKVVRGPRIDGTATYPVTVVDGIVYAEVPSNIVSGKSTQSKTAKTGRRDPKDKRVFALIGGGAASLAAAEVLREEGFGGRIVMFCKEPHLPYDRQQLSKQMEKTAADLQLRPAEFFKERDIEVVLDTAITKLDSKGRKVHYKAASGAAEQTLEYDRVLVASGGSPRKLFCPGSSLKGIHTLRTAEDAAEICRYVKKNQKMIVVGGSFIGMEVASHLKQKGCDVSVIAMESVPFERVLGKKIGAAFARLLQKENIQWYGSSQVRLFRGNETVNGIELEDGEVLPADAVVVGAGVLPNTRFVEGITLDKNGAVVVGPLLSSEAEPTLFAAGDVCSYPALRTGTQVRIEHWDVATQQGRTAARNMMGECKPFTTTPFFWSQIMNKTLRFVGHAPEVLDRVITEGDVAGFDFVSYYTENDEIMAVATVNRDALSFACAELMRRGKMPKVSELVLGIVNQEVIMERMRVLSGVPAK